MPSFARFILVALALISIGTPSYASDAIDEAIKIRKTCEAKVTNLNQAFIKEMMRIKDQEKRTARKLKLDREVADLQRTACKEIFEHLEPEAADPQAAELLAVVVQYSRDQSIQWQAAKLLTEHHLAHAKTIELAILYRQTCHAWLHTMLTAMHASDKVKTADRPRVDLAYAQHIKMRSELPAMLDEMSDEEIQNWYFRYGIENIMSLRELDAAELEAQAIELYEALKAAHGKEKLDNVRTLGDLADSEIFSIRNMSVGKQPPDLFGKDLNGKTIRLSDYRGSVVMVTFWGTWCGPCMELIPHEVELANRLSGQPFAILGVNSDPRIDIAKKSVDTHNVPFPSLWCGEQGTFGALPRAWNIERWPAVFVLDKNGVIRARHTSGKNLDPIIEKLIEEEATSEPIPD